MICSWKLKEILIFLISSSDKWHLKLPRVIKLKSLLYIVQYCSSLHDLWILGELQMKICTYIVYSPSMLLAYIINYQRYNYETYVCLFHVHVNRLLWIGRLLWIALQSYIKLFSPQSKQYTNSPWGGLEQKQIMQIHFCLFFAHQLSKSTDSCLFFLTNEFLSPNWVNFWYFFTFHNLYMGRYWDNSKYKYVFFFSSDITLVH